MEKRIETTIWGLGVYGFRGFGVLGLGVRVIAAGLRNFSKRVTKLMKGFGSFRRKNLLVISRE